MTQQKININIVYSPQKGSPHVIYRNNKAIIWNSPKYDAKKINIGMGWYSIRKPRTCDSLIVMEPRCVLERDYNPKYIEDYKFIFTWAAKAFKSIKLDSPKIIEINHPCRHTPIRLENLKKSWVPWHKRSNEIVFIANNKSSTHSSQLYTLRVQLADLFHKNSSIKVSWYGQIPLKKPYYKGSVPSKLDILNKVKFSVCCENSYDSVFSHNYFSEKLPDAWCAGTVPLYMGCYNIDDFGFAPNSYIDLRKYVKKASKQKHSINKNLIKVVSNFNHRQYQQLLKSVQNNINKPKGLNYIIKYERTYETIINTILKSNLVKL